jgi:nitrogen-specific signal transduction histidine kinase
MNQLTQLRQLIKESIQEYIREVETSGNVAAQEAKIRACDEAIALREKKINLEGLDEAYQDMIDEAKKKNLEKEIKELQKYKKKAEKILEKMKSKSAPKKMEDESVEEEAVIDEVSLDEMSPELEEEDATLDEAKKKKAAKKDKEEKEEKEVVNESFLRMQKIAGIIK